MEKDFGLVRILKNISFSAFSLILNRIGQIVLFVFIARITGADGLGAYTLALSLVAIFGVITDLGLNSLIVREVAANKRLAARYLGNMAVLRYLLSLLSLTAVILLTFFSHFPSATKTIIYLIAIGNFFVTCGFGLRWIFQAFQKLQYEAYVNIFWGVSLTVLGILALKLNFGLLGLSRVQLGLSVLSLVLIWFLVFKNFFRFQLRIEPKFWKELFKEALPFALTLIFMTIYLNSDTVILSWLKGEKSAGIYNAANKLILQVKNIPVILGPALLPALAEASVKKPDVLQGFLEKELTYLAILLLPLCVIITILGEKIMFLLYDSGFGSSVIVLKILIWSALFMVLYSTGLRALMAVKKVTKLAILTGIGMLLNLVLNFLLIPSFGAKGAAISILATEIAVFFGIFYLLHWELQFRFRSLLAPWGKIALSGVFMASFLLEFKNLPLYVSISASVIIYLFFLAVLKVIPLQDWKIFKGVLVPSKPKSSVKIGRIDPLENSIRRP